MSKGKEPVFTIENYWPIRGAIWERIGEGGRVYYQFSIDRSYTTTNEAGEKEYHSSQSFNVNDAQALKQTIDDCWGWIMIEGRKRAREQKQNIATGVAAKAKAAA